MDGLPSPTLQQPLLPSESLVASPESNREGSTRRIATYFAAFHRFRHSREASALVVSLAIFTDMISYGIVLPILPGKLERMGRDVNNNGSLFASFAVGSLMLTPIFGVLSDRYHTRKIPLFFGLFSLGVATVLPVLATEYWHLILARFAQGVSDAATWSIGLSMVADVYPADKLGMIMGTVYGANTLGCLVGPPIGGLAHQYWSEDSPFYIIGIFALLTVLGLVLVVPPVLPSTDSTAVTTETPSREPVTGPTDRTHSKKLAVPQTSGAAGMFRLLRSPLVAVLCVATMAVSQVMSGLEPTLPLFLRDQFHADEGTIGMMFTAIVVPNIFVSPLAGYYGDRFGRMWVTMFGMVLLAVVAPLIALTRNYAVMAIPLMLCGTSSAIALTPLMPEFADYVRSLPDVGFGAIYALFNMSYSFGALCGFVLGGYMYPLGFLYELLAFSGLLFMCVPAVFVFAWKRKRGGEGRAQQRDAEEMQSILSLDVAKTGELAAPL